MISLIENEFIKIFSRISSWVYMIILTVMLFAGALLMKIVLGQMMPESPPTNWEYMELVVPFVASFVTLFTVIVGSGNVAAEFSDGTIKQLLIRPYQRWKILLSKYIAITLYSAILLVLLLFFGFIFGLLFYGVSDFSAESKIVSSMNGNPTGGIGKLFFYHFLLFIPSLLIVTSFAFMLSTLFRSQAVAVGLGVFILFSSSTAGQVISLFMNKYHWMKFLIFPHLDLTKYAVSPVIMKGITLPFSLSILLIYYVIFMALTFIFFQKRDISI